MSDRVRPHYNTGTLNHCRLTHRGNEDTDRVYLTPSVCKVGKLREDFEDSGRNGRRVIGLARKSKEFQRGSRTTNRMEDCMLFDVSCCQLGAVCSGSFFSAFGLCPYTLKTSSVGCCVGYKTDKKCAGRLAE